MIGGPEFQTVLHQITGKEVNGASAELHRLGSGDFIGEHTDARDGRALGFIYYMGEWSQHWGAFQVTHLDGRVRSIVPKHNSGLLFDVEGHRSHSVTRVLVDHYRFSANIWFYKQRFRDCTR